MTENRTRPLERLAILADPTRRRLYEYVVAQPTAVDRDSAARALVIGRPLAAFHLDRLAEEGLLDVEFHRRSGRSGPGAGRPAKFYRRGAGPEIEVSLPARRYALAAEILADGVDTSRDPAVKEAVLDAARAAGKRLAASISSSGRDGLLEALRANGYEPFEDPAGAVRLRNCPFDALTQRHRDLTCSMNLALLGAATGRAPGSGLTAEARPAEGLCCVALVPAS